MSQQFKYVNGLNSIRFIAVILVIIGHWGLGYERGTAQFEAIKVFIPWGKFGLAFFLVLSGFLISSVLFKARRDMAANDNKCLIVRNFLVRRALRLLPVYYLMLFILYLLHNKAMTEHPFYFLTHTSNILVYRTQQLNPLIHLWSLSVQEQFYVLLPWLILFVKEKYIKYVIYSCIVIGVVSKFIELEVLHRGFPFLVWHSFDSLGLGVLYAFYTYTGKNKEFEKVIKFSLPLLLYLGWQMSYFRGTAIGVTYERTMWSLMGLSIIIFTLNNDNRWLQKHFFENKTLNYFGKISYGIYLYHYPIGSYFDYHVGNYMTQHPLPYFFGNFYFLYLVKFILVLTVATVSYNFFEQPIIGLKKRFNYLKNKVVTPL